MDSSWSRMSTSSRMLVYRSAPKELRQEGHADLDVLQRTSYLVLAAGRQSLAIACQRAAMRLRVPAQLTFRPGARLGREREVHQDDGQGAQGGRCFTAVQLRP